MKRLSAVTSSRDYDVLVGRGCLPSLGGALASRVPGGQIVLCCDENVAPLYLGTVGESLRAAGYPVSQIVIPAGEAQKSLARAEELYGVLYDRGLRRSDTLVALGGGVIGDLIGFVAATYQRGIRLRPNAHHAARAGRRGDRRQGGSGLPRREELRRLLLPALPGVRRRRHAGLPAGPGAAQRIRGGSQVRSGGRRRAARELRGSGRSQGPLLPSRSARRWSPRASSAKLDVVAADEREESGARAVLNLGHTIGHAIEGATAFSRFSHGEAVGLGLRAALWLSEKLCGLPAADAARGQALLDGLGLPQRVTDVPVDLICDLTRRDKKAGKDGVGYVLLEQLGSPVIGVPVSAAIEREAVEWLTRR